MNEETITKLSDRNDFIRLLARYGDLRFQCGEFQRLRIEQIKEYQKVSGESSIAWETILRLYDKAAGI